MNLNIKITVEDNSIHRNFELIDGQAPDNMQETIQDMVNTLLDKDLTNNYPDTFTSEKDQETNE